MRSIAFDVIKPLIEAAGLKQDEVIKIEITHDTVAVTVVFAVEQPF